MEQAHLDSIELAVVNDRDAVGDLCCCLGAGEWSRLPVAWGSFDGWRVTISV